jgi:hypothetical protein
MTKEEILRKHYDDFDIESNWMFDGSVSDVFNAMDEYAKEQAIAFRKYLDEEGYVISEYGHPYYTKRDSENLLVTEKIDNIYQIFSQPQTTNTDTKSERPEST